MCGRVAIHHAVQDLESQFQAKLNECEVEPVPRYNVGPGQPLIVLRSDSVRRMDRELVHLQWGLIPPWFQSIRDRTGPLANARAETAAAKPSFRHALRRRRCVIPVSGFYEWAHSGKGPPQPYYFSQSDGELLPVAGLWEIWHGPAGEVLETCCILTRDAAGIMKGIHSRMPVLLPSEDIDRWLAPDLEEPPRELLMSDLAAQLTCWPVSTRVNSVRNDGPDLIQPVEISHPPQPTEPSPNAIQQNDLFG